MEVAHRGVVAYSKLFSKKARLVSREWYPDLANYRRNGYDFDSHYEGGLANYREKCIIDILLREGPTLSKDLKRLTGFGSNGLRGFDIVMTNLQMQTYVTVHSFEYARDKYGKLYGYCPLCGDGGYSGSGSDAGSLRPQPGRIQGEDHPTLRDAVPGCI